MKLFREWLREKERELEEAKELALLNEIFDYISNYKEVSSTKYIKYRENMLKVKDPYYLELGIDLEAKRQKEHGPRVHYYKYKSFLIYYGKFKYSNKYEVHFLDLDNLDANILSGKGTYSTIFSAVMSILKDKHFDKGRSDDIYIVNTDQKKIDFYEVLIKSILNKYNQKEWFIKKDRRGLVISKNEDIITERDTMVLKQIMSQEDKELLDRLDENNNYV